MNKIETFQKIIKILQKSKDITRHFLVFRPTDDPLSEIKTLKESTSNLDDRSNEPKIKKKLFYKSDLDKLDKSILKSYYCFSLGDKFFNEPLVFLDKSQDLRTLQPIFDELELGSFIVGTVIKIDQAHTNFLKEGQKTISSDLVCNSKKPDFFKLFHILEPKPAMVIGDEKYQSCEEEYLKFLNKIKETDNNIEDILVIDLKNNKLQEIKKENIKNINQPSYRISEAKFKALAEQNKIR